MAYNIKVKKTTNYLHRYIEVYIDTSIYLWEFPAYKRVYIKIRKSYHTYPAIMPDWSVHTEPDRKIRLILLLKI